MGTNDFMAGPGRIHRLKSHQTLLHSFGQLAAQATFTHLQPLQTSLRSSGQLAAQTTLTLLQPYWTSLCSYGQLAAQGAFTACSPPDHSMHFHRPTTQAFNCQ